MHQATQPTRFPVGSVRESVALMAENELHICGRQRSADAKIMHTDESLRHAGAKPAQRASWREYVATYKHESGQPHGI